MTTQLWANEAGTTLAAAITSTATTLTVVNGSSFPAPVTGQGFQLTLTSATNSAFQEIVTCTARSGATLGGLLRGQEGTTAQAFSAGDLAQNLITAGALQSLANINGSTSQQFSVAFATSFYNAPAYGQFNSLLTNPNYFYMANPQGAIVQAYEGINATGADVITFPNAFPHTCTQCFAIEGSPSGWEGVSPTIMGTQQLSATNFALYVMKWTGSAWKLQGAINYRYVAYGW